MKIAGLIKSSLIDYPGKIAAVVFTQGCNFRCGFCHNPDLISATIPEGAKRYDEDEIFSFLQKRVGKLDGVVITGGEPLFQADLEQFITKIKQLGFLVKLDTNGSSPERLEAMLNVGLVDFVAMDIKGPLEKYAKICSYSNTKVIQRSIDLLMKSNVPYEFRTTVLPAYHDISDFEKVGEMIKGAKKFTIQGFRPQITLDHDIRDSKSFSRNELERIRDVISPYVEETIIHENR